MNYEDIICVLQTLKLGACRTECEALDAAISLAEKEMEYENVKQMLNEEKEKLKQLTQSLVTRQKGKHYEENNKNRNNQ